MELSLSPALQLPAAISRPVPESTPKHARPLVTTTHLAQPHPRAPTTLLAAPSTVLYGLPALSALPQEHESAQEENGQERAKERPDDNAGRLGF